MRALFKVFLAVMFLAGEGHAAFAEKRVALVIGNGAYQKAPELPNPKNDAEDMAAALKALGFTVILGIDLDKRAMDAKILAFANALSGADTGVFHYSGHGLQVSGVNYLVPIDAELATAAALDFETVRLDLIQRTMEREAKTNILFLDACRNNPLARNLARALGTRSADIGRGLAATEAGVGTLIGFSTQPGNVALDGSGRTSPYSGPLAKAISASGKDLSSILIDVRNAVLAATNEKQVPWEHSALRAPFYFNGAAATATLEPSKQPASQPQAPISEAAQTWDRIKDAKNPAVFKAFREQFGKTNPVYDSMAADREAELKQGMVAITASPKPISTIPPDPTCDGLLVSVAQSSAKPCIKPGSGESFKDCANCPEMVIAPAGSFTMGATQAEIDELVKQYSSSAYKDEGPPHRVTISKPFAAGRFAVTFREWDTCVWQRGCGDYRPNDQGWGRDDRPVINVSWDDAKAYVAWLSKTTGQTYRLLTEAEREYVARAGTTTPFWWGSTITTGQANYDGNYTYASGSKGEYRQKTVPVNAFKPNPWGLHQVHGNVYDWVEDCYHDSYQGAPADGSARTSGECKYHVLRGGSWGNDPQDLRAAYRYGYLPGFRNLNVGFRVARTLTP
jgi:formylglycine-generating enzyme required for sulfatase activity